MKIAGWIAVPNWESKAVRIVRRTKIIQINRIDRRANGQSTIIHAQRHEWLTHLRMQTPEFFDLAQLYMNDIHYDE